MKLLCTHQLPTKPGMAGAQQIKSQMPEAYKGFFGSFIMTHDYILGISGTDILDMLSRQHYLRGNV